MDECGKWNCFRWNIFTLHLAFSFWGECTFLSTRKVILDNGFLEVLRAKSRLCGKCVTITHFSVKKKQQLVSSPRCKTCMARARQKLEFVAVLLRARSVVVFAAAGCRRKGRRRTSRRRSTCCGDSSCASAATSVSENSIVSFHKAAVKKKQSDPSSRFPTNCPAPCAR